MENKQSLKQYVEQLRAFQRHMQITFEVLMDENADSDSIDLFYESDFEIKWRGKSVKLGNGADVFQGLEYIISKEIDDYEEAVKDE